MSATASGTRIGFDARLIGALGIGRYINGLLPPLAALLGDRLTVIAQSRDAALVRGLLGPRPTLRLLNAMPYRLAEQVSLPLALRRAGLDLVHFPHYNLPLAWRTPFVATVHDLFPFDYPEIHSGLLPRAVNQILLRNAVRRARIVVTPSLATAAAVRRRFSLDAARVVNIPEAADDRFSPDRDPSGERAWQARLRIQPPYVLYLGQWKAYKNLPLLLQAFAEVRTASPSAQLVLAGDDPRHPEVRRLAAGLPSGSVVLPGRLPDAAIPDLYRGAAAVVLPSRAEGFGLPVMEAMACGVRVVCSDLPALREIADGVATFCDPGDAHAFAQAILHAMAADSDEVIRRGIERARTYSWQRAAAATLAVYEDAIAVSVGVTLEEDSRRREDQDLEIQSK
jgi:glycosyltransferase involved in cell wall biosynthesis